MDGIFRYKALVWPKGITPESSLKLDSKLYYLLTCPCNSLSFMLALDIRRGVNLLISTVLFVDKKWRKEE